MFRNARPRMLFALTALVAGGVVVASSLDRGEEADAAQAADGQRTTPPRFSAVEDTALRAALQEVREATEKYRNLEAAREAGYVRDPMNRCEAATDQGKPVQLGGMGVHYFRPDLLEITEEKPRVNGTGTHTDFKEPGVLVYEPQADGSMELVAVENMVFREAWDAEHDSRPSFHGLEYYTMTDNPRTEVDEAHMFRPHYELHLWVHRENPIAVYSEWNPRVTCEQHEPADAAAESTEDSTGPAPARASTGADV